MQFWFCNFIVKNLNALVMKKILQQLEDYMILKNYSQSTLKCYLSAVRNFYLWCEMKKDDSDFSKENAHRQYLVHRYKKGLAWQTVNGDYSAIRMLYTKILNRKWEEKKTPRPRKENALPLVISQQDISKLIDNAAIFKHQMFFILLYATGLRLSEALHLKFEDIDRKRLQIRVRRGKGHKDRYIIFPNSLLPVLEKYFKYYRPHLFIFNGRVRNSQWSIRSAQEAIIQARRRAKIHQSVTAHTLRHCYATHHLENGTDIFTLQKQLGHKNLRTTARYIHLCNKSFTRIFHPLDQLAFCLKNIISDNSSDDLENSTSKNIDPT